MSQNKRGGRYNALVLMSGGPDSSTLLFQVKKSNGSDPIALHFNTGLVPNKYELAASKAVSDSIEVPLQVIDISHFIAACGGKGPTIHSEAHVLQFGTSFLLSAASAFAIENDIPEVFVALHQEDAEESVEYSPKFIKFMNSGLELIETNCKVVAPFHSWTKARILKHGQELGVPLGKTWSCLTPIRGRQCGSCGACRARRGGFGDARLKDPTKYAFL